MIGSLNKFEYYSSSDGTIYHGDALAVLQAMPGESVHCVVISLPYWMLGDYIIPPVLWPKIKFKPMPSFSKTITVPEMECCLGLESDPWAYVGHIFLIFRALKKDGTHWLVIGDSYNGSGGAGGDYNEGGLKERQPKYGPKNTKSLKKKDLYGIPWKVSFALQADGWFLRNDIIWSKKNCMPESAKDRCTKAHEYIFLLSKSQRYYFDSKSIHEKQNEHERPRRLREQKKGLDKIYELASEGKTGLPSPPKNGALKSNKRCQELAQIGLRNKRSVWTVSTLPFPEAHFATYPPKLIEPCILAGCPKGGIVLDPFIGSGTTALVAHKFDQKFIGIELNKQYLDEIALQRIKKETSQLKLFPSNLP